MLGNFPLVRLEQNIQYKLHKKFSFDLGHVFLAEPKRTGSFPFMVCLFSALQPCPESCVAHKQVRSSFTIFSILVLFALLGLTRRSICLVHCQITSAIVISMAESRNVNIKYSPRRALLPFSQDVQMGPHSSRESGLLSKKFGICSITNKKRFFKNFKLSALEPNIPHVIYSHS